ncbi:VOC family protein [Yinghuangia seranimata]|uniref:VOC family protein n=1 Tax=Yinghuangia seranimata TaxID=408067 RepID=UPI00248B5DBE|nr:VOC family protein [Yinghuangia seranimata]MDI2130013.1 VOC family protein [Yinghuangia seranimata]
MTSLVRHITFDCSDPYTLAGFWAEVTSGKISEEDSPGDDEVLVENEGTPLLFIRVPEAKQVKNRVHMDLQPQDRTRDEEVARFVALGASVVDDRRTPEGPGWVVMADLEGNEFCVERSEAERAATATA